MPRIAFVAPLALAALVVLAGCQSEEEKRAEQQKLKEQIKQEILNSSDLNDRISSEVSIKLQQAIEDHKRKLQQEADRIAAEKAAAAKPAVGKPTTGAKPATAPTTTPKKH
jgi:hypothetical protein